MDSLEKPQIICHSEQSLDYTIHDVKWIPCSNRFVAIGGKSNGAGIVEIYSLTTEGVHKLDEFGKKDYFRCCTFDASSLRNRHLATGDFAGRLQVFDLEDPLVPVYQVNAHKSVINCIDGVAGANVNCGAPELVTGSRDGNVFVWDVRQKDVPVAKLLPVDESTARDCWTVAFGNSFNKDERVIAAGYDNGDVKIYDLRKNAVTWSTNLKNGVVSLQFDRKDIAMNKLVITTLEATMICFDLRTKHPKKGYASVKEKAHQSTIWCVRHVPQNREIFMTTGGSGTLRLWKYNYPIRRVEKDPVDGIEYGVPGELVPLQNCTLTEQPITAFDWCADKLGLAVCSSYDQHLRIIITTKLNLY